MKRLVQIPARFNFAIFAILVFFLLSACSSESEQPIPEVQVKIVKAKVKVVYYSQNGCPLCEKNKAILAALEQEHYGDIILEVKDKDTEESQKEITELDLGDHGMVVYDAEGKNIKSKLGQHNLSEEEIKQAVISAL